MDIIEPRQMTYDERCALIEAGLDPMYCDMGDTSPAMIDHKVTKWIKENVMGNPVGPDAKIRLTARKIWELTISGDEEEEKNSLRSGDGTAKEPTSAENALASSVRPKNKKIVESVKEDAQT